MQEQENEVWYIVISSTSIFIWHGEATLAQLTFTSLEELGSKNLNTA
jgi:hypothetical protein